MKKMKPVLVALCATLAVGFTPPVWAQVETLAGPGVRDVKAEETGAVAPGEDPEDDPAGTPASRAVLSLSLGEALDLARENSFQIRNAEQDLRRSTLALRESRVSRLPSLTVDGQYTNNVQTPVIFLPEGSPFGSVLRTGMRHNMNAAAQATMPIYNAQLNRTIDLSRAARNFQQAMLSVTEHDVEVEVQRAFVNGLLMREALRVLEESHETRRQNVALIRSMHGEGLVPEYDLIRAEVQVENMQPELVRARTDLEGAQNYIKLLTGIAIATPLQLDGALEDLYASLPAIHVNADFRRNPDLIRVDAQRSVVESQLRLERAAYLPSLSAFGNYTYQSQGNELTPADYNWVNSSAVGFRVSIPIFSPQRNLRVEQAEVDLRQLEMQRAYLLESLQAEFETTASRLAQVRETIAAQERNVAQAERGLYIARVSYENGVHSVVEVNDAELALTQARMNYANALSEYVHAVLDLEDLLGRSASGS